MTESAHLSSEVSFFSDKDEVCDLISSLCSQNVKDDEKTLQLLEKFLIKYQEQPQLLEPHLVSMIEPINENLLGIVTNEVRILTISEI